MSRYIITSGKVFLDIDAYAGILAYGRLLEALGENVVCASTATPNESVAPIVREMGFRLDDYPGSAGIAAPGFGRTEVNSSSSLAASGYEKSEEDRFVVMDVSDPEMFDRIVGIDKVVEVIDHHTGFEEYWKEKIGDHAHIEFIGSICTIVFERYERHGKLDLLDNKMCKLLMAGILDNTLNLKASVTTERDVRAYNELMRIGNVANDWGEIYFLSCQAEVEKDLRRAIENDVKTDKVSGMLPELFGQLLILDEGPILKRREEIAGIMRERGGRWMVNIIGMGDGKSYILAEGEKVQENLERLLGGEFRDGILTLDKFMLRKEIMKRAREFVFSVVQ